MFFIGYSFGQRIADNDTRYKRLQYQSIVKLPVLRDRIK